MMGVHLAKNSKTRGSVPAPAARILGVWEAPIRALPARGPPGHGPREPPNALGPGREGGGPGSHALPSAFTHWPCTHPASCAQPSLSPLLLGIQMVSTMAPPPPAWAPGRAGPDHPIAVLAQSHHASPVTVCPPPPLRLSSRPPRSSSSPVHPAASTRLLLTFSASLLPASSICSSQGRPWAGRALRLSPPLRALSLPRNRRRLQWR